MRVAKSCVRENPTKAKNKKNILWKGKHKKRKGKEKKVIENMQPNLQSKPNLRLKTGEKKSLSSFNTSDNKSLNPAQEASHEVLRYLMSMYLTVVMGGGG